MLKIKTPVQDKAVAGVKTLVTGLEREVPEPVNQIAAALARVEAIVAKCEQQQIEPGILAEGKQLRIAPEVVRELLTEIEREQTKAIRESFIAGWNAALSDVFAKVEAHRGISKRDAGTVKWIIGGALRLKKDEK